MTTPRLTWKVQSRAPSGRWIRGAVHATRADAEVDAAGRTDPSRIKSIRN